jgi:hypothetical protein
MPRSQNSASPTSMSICGSILAPANTPKEIVDR